ncbi:hypothetical protein [Nocardia miyunensis]|uniref:hypothetical protein n=1 Tax=Nocardia miyunensis TaxID=282684 RepID=UPI00082AE749|nr:hypothetical protein [Nocardia miyunensis]
MTDRVWRGVAIAESFTCDSVITNSTTIRTDAQALEGEGSLGQWHFHFIEVADSEIDMVVGEALRTLKPSWYLHLVNADRMIVVFEGRSFTITQDDTHGIAEVKEYAVGFGVHPEQIELERLFDNPYDE